jgi:glycosyltransferase involved in cell wall biosynthesis
VGATKNKMRILHVLNHICKSGNGIVNVAVDLACLQAEAGHTVGVASLGGDYKTLLQTYGVQHFPLNQTRKLINIAATIQQFQKLVHEFQPDIVHAHMVTGLILAKLPQIKTCYAIVSSVHNEFQRSSILMGLADRVIAVSDAVGRSMHQRGVPLQKLRVVHNGTLQSPRAQPLGNYHALPLHRPAITTVAGLYQRKGISDLIAAFSQIHGEFPDAHLYIVGEGPDRPFFEAEAYCTAAAKQIHFVGFHPEPQRYLLSTDIFVLASHQDPCPLVISEAREAGCAVVASHVDGIPKSLEDGQAGLLFPPKDINSLSTLLRQLLSNPQRLQTWKERARHNLDWLSVDRVHKQTLAVYRELVPLPALQAVQSSPDPQLQPPSPSDSKHNLNYPAQFLFLGMGWFPSTPGGLNRYVYELTHQLTSHQDQVDLWGIGFPDIPSSPTLRLTNLASSETHWLARLWTIRKHLTHLKKLSPDAINLHFALYSLPLLANLPPDQPITFTFHGPWASESEQEGRSKGSVLFKQWIEQQVYRHCDRFIVLSQAFATVLQHQYRVPEHKINIIPGGVDTTRFQASLSREQARTLLNWPQDRFVLFTPRRLVQRMGISQLLNAIALIRAEIPEIWLAIAGKGPLQVHLQQQVEELELSPFVRFLGYIPDEQLAISYQAADLSVVPSQSLEGFGLTLLESLACGTPVLCTPVGGMPEVITPFSPHLVSETIHAPAIADRLQQIIKHKRLLPSRTACRDYVLKQFDWPTIAQHVRQVLLHQG